MAIDISAGAVTASVGLFGILIGTLIGPYVNHKLNLKNARKDIIFKRKLEFFEKLAENIEQNLRIYKSAIGEVETKKTPRDIKKIINGLKEKRKNYLILASPLYFNIKNLSIKITNFVEIEKNIFNDFTKITKDKEIISNLKEKLNNLTSSRDSVINEMKKELYKK
jgi:hypothetical protein